MATPVRNDFENLARSESCRQMLSRYGDNTPRQERVVGSWPLTKINHRGKKQDRVLLLTDKAFYNLKPKKLSKCQRRIDLQYVDSISIAPDGDWLTNASDDSAADQFIVHVPREYDYLFESTWKNHIASVIAGTCSRVQSRAVKVKTLEAVVAPKHAVMTKKNSGTLSPQEKQQLIVLRQQPSVMPDDAYEYRPGKMAARPTIKKMCMSIGKAKSYALRLENCVAFSVHAYAFIDWDREYDIEFKAGEVRIEEDLHWHTFIMGVGAQRRC